MDRTPAFTNMQWSRTTSWDEHLDSLFPAFIVPLKQVLFPLRCSPNADPEGTVDYLKLRGHRGSPDSTAEIVTVD